MPTTLKSQVIFVKTKQEHPANIPGMAEWTSEIKALVKKKIEKEKSQLSAAGGFIFKTRAN